MYFALTQRNRYTGNPNDDQLNGFTNDGDHETCDVLNAIPTTLSDWRLFTKAAHPLSTLKVTALVWAYLTAWGWEGSPPRPEEHHRLHWANKPPHRKRKAINGRASVCSLALSRWALLRYGEFFS